MIIFSRDELVVLIKQNNENFNQENNPKNFEQQLYYRRNCCSCEGTIVFVIVINALGINCRTNTQQCGEKIDSERVKVADKRINENTRERRMRRKPQQIDILKAFITIEKLLYGPEIKEYFKEFSPGDVEKYN